MSNRRPFRRQRSVKGGRKRLSPYVTGVIKDIVKQTSRHFHVSESFVESVALETFFGVKSGESFTEPRSRKGK